HSRCSHDRDSCWDAPCASAVQSAMSVDLIPLPTSRWPHPPRTAGVLADSDSNTFRDRRFFRLPCNRPLWSIRRVLASRAECQQIRPTATLLPGPELLESPCVANRAAIALDRDWLGELPKMIAITLWEVLVA